MVMLTTNTCIRKGMKTSFLLTAPVELIFTSTPEWTDVSRELLRNQKPQCQSHAKEGGQNVYLTQQPHPHWWGVAAN